MALLGSITKDDITYEYTDNLGDSVLNYHIYDILWKKDIHAKYYQDSTLKATHTTYPPNVNLGAYLRSAETGEYVRCDWVLIRKYVDCEPAHGSWGSEEELSKVPVFMAHYRRMRQR